MAQYSKVTDANGTTRYKDGTKFVAADNVPETVKTTLADAAEGSVVDELGEPVNPETDTDESVDEAPPTQDDVEADDETDADESEEDQTPPPAQPPAPEAPQQTPTESAPTPQDEEGMGFKRAKGKTLSIFSNQPHETVKNINGIMAPLTVEEYNTKTDGEIIEKLRSLKKYSA